MKTRPNLLLTIALASATASVAAAYSFSPTQTKFTLKGSALILIGDSYTGCTLRLTGRILRHSQDSVIETLSDEGTCGVTATNLPWTLKAKNATTAAIGNFAYTVPGNVCPPKTAQATVSGNGVWTLRTKVQGSTDGCRLLITLPSRPPITIVP